MDTKEIVALTEKWLEQIKQITVNYNTSVAQLEKARSDYEKQTKKWYLIVLPYFIPIIAAVIILVAFVIAIRFVGCPNPIHITFQDIELTQTCTK
jgi:hypothetical protein